MSIQINKQNNHTLVISYLNLRKAVGYLGVLLPFIMVIGTYLAGLRTILSSISSYYHSNMGDVFVGILCAIAMFLFSYKGYERKDNIAANLAALFALGVAFFPTTPASNVADADIAVGRVHLTCAALFFLTLSYMSLRLFTKTGGNGVMTVMKKRRNSVYRLCGYLMLASIVLIALYKLVLRDKLPELERFDPVFWLETVAILAFGFSWLTKGEAILADVEG